MKKFILLLSFVLLNILLSAKEISIVVRDKYRVPLKGATVKIEDEIKITDNKGNVSFDSSKDNLSITITKDGFESKNIEIFSSDRDSFNIELDNSKESRKFVYLVVKYNEYIDSSYFLDELTDTENFASNTIINFYKDNNLVKSVDFNNSTLPVLLNYGEYDIKAFNIYNNNIEFNNIKISKESEDFLVINLKRETFVVTGKVITEKAFLGGVNLIFNDGFGNSFTTKTDIEGYYSINLPENNYTIKAEKTGYQLLGEHSLFVNENSGSYNINMSETGSFLAGIIVDQDNLPLANTTVTLRSSLNEVVTVITNDLGLFKAKVPKGMVLIKAEKSGYYTSGTLKRVENFSTMDGISIQLTQKTGSIKGYLINNIKAAQYFNLKLHNSKGEFIGNSKTNERGFYEFASLPIWDEYFVTVEKGEKEYYRSDILTIEENEKLNLDIIIDIETINVIIEVTDGENIVSDVNLLLNETEYTTDINGFVNQYFSTEEINELNIELPDYEISDRIALNSDTKSPLKLKYDISK